MWFRVRISELGVFSLAWRFVRIDSFQSLNAGFLINTDGMNAVFKIQSRIFIYGIDLHSQYWEIPSTWNDEVWYPLPLEFFRLWMAKWICIYRCYWRPLQVHAVSKSRIQYHIFSVFRKQAQQWCTVVRARIQEYKNTRIQVYKYTSIQVCKRSPGAFGILEERR